MVIMLCTLGPNVIEIYNCCYGQTGLSAPDTHSNDYTLLNWDTSASWLNYIFTCCFCEVSTVDILCNLYVFIIISPGIMNFEK